jgi:chromosomal replication initiator protein
LIDDIQFIIDKDSTQEEFFHTFNTLKEAKKQIILSSDRPPKELNGMPDRLINRFESGILADIGSPNYEIRMAILRKKAESEHLNIGDDILQFIAEHITSNIRELEGALNKIFVYSKLQNNSEPIDIAFAEEALKDMIKPDKIHEITPDLIIETVCEHYKITKEQIISSSRSQNIAKPRMIAMYLCKNLLSNMTLKEIGSYLGGKNHTTVMHGCEKVVEDMEDDPNFRNNIDILINKISS